MRDLPLISKVRFTLDWKSRTVCLAKDLFPQVGVLLDLLRTLCELEFDSFPELSGSLRMSEYFRPVHTFFLN